jgi:hypothetical protein
MRLFPATLAGAVALAFAEMAVAQAPTTIAPNSTNIEQQGAQNSTQVGTDNQSTQVYGNDNQTSATQGDQNQTTQQGEQSVYQSGKQNQSAQGSGNQQSQQYGSGNSNEQTGRTAANEHNRQYGNSGTGASARGERHDKGKHKGWYKNKKEDND